MDGQDWVLETKGSMEAVEAMIGSSRPKEAVEALIGSSRPKDATLRQ
jgi:hypothetical protein